MDFASMSVGELARVIGGSLFATSVIIQVSPIKLDPWSFIAKALGKAMFGDTCAEIKRISKRLDSYIVESDERYAKSVRIRIIRFGDEMSRGVNHSKDHFDQILFDCDFYLAYCDQHPLFKNSITELTIKRIKQQYSDCLKKGTFL